MAVENKQTSEKQKGEIKMMNTYRMTMRGLRKAAGETKGLRGYYGGGYVQISYDTGTGDVLTDYHYSIGNSWWTQYHDQAIITVCNARRQMTMQQIADAIARAVAMSDTVSA